jgi:hypothetical protein
MKSKTLSWAVRVVVVLLLAVATGALAQAPTPTHFSGLVNDYTPATVAGKLVGPYVMHGTWTLDLKGRSGLADFSAAMTMELAEYTVVNGVVTMFDDPAARIAHTHHITMKDAPVSYATGMCPVNAPATTNPGFMISGPAYITGNGAPAPFSKGDTVLSTLQVCVNGGLDVPFSNVTLVFGAPASGHFGAQAIHGVVHRPKQSGPDDRDR